MLKKFHGAHLMEALHRKKLRDLLSKEMLASRLVKIFIASLAMITLWAIPTAAFGVEGLTLVQQRVIAIFVFAILMWIFHAIPAWTTSTFVVAGENGGTATGSLYNVRMSTADAASYKCEDASFKVTVNAPETGIDEVKGEKITNTITDYATSLIIDYGVDAHYVMYEMKLWEIPLFFEAVSTKMMRDMEQKRFWTYLNIMPHIDTKKCKSPEALLPFKWEKGKRQERAEQNLKNNLYAVKHTIGKSIFGDKDKKENG